MMTMSILLGSGRVLFKRRVPHWTQTRGKRRRTELAAICAHLVRVGNICPVRTPPAAKSESLPPRGHE